MLVLSIGPLRTIFRETLIEIDTLAFKKTHWKYLMYDGHHFVLVSICSNHFKVNRLMIHYNTVQWIASMKLHKWMHETKQNVYISHIMTTTLTILSSRYWEWGEVVVGMLCRVCVCVCVCVWGGGGGGGCSTGNWSSLSLPRQDSHHVGYSNYNTPVLPRVC